MARNPACNAPDKADIIENAINALIANGANVDAATRDGSTPLHEAAAKGHVGAMEALIVGNANVDAALSSGRTALHMAAYAKNAPMCKLLIDHGANCDLKDKDRKTPVDLAEELGHAHELAKEIRELNISERAWQVRRSGSDIPLPYPIQPSYFVDQLEQGAPQLRTPLLTANEGYRRLFGEPEPAAPRQSMVERAGRHGGPRSNTRRDEVARESQTGGDGYSQISFV